MVGGGAGLGRGVLSFGLGSGFTLQGSSAGPAGPAGLPAFVGSSGKRGKGGSLLYGGVFDRSPREPGPIILGGGGSLLNVGVDDLARAPDPTEKAGGLGGNGFTVIPGGRANLFGSTDKGGALKWGISGGGGIAVCLGSLMIVGGFSVAALAGRGLAFQSTGAGTGRAFGSAACTGPVISGSRHT